MAQTALLLVANIGKAVGLKGALKLHILSDFPEIFKPQAQFHIKSHLDSALDSTINATLARESALESSVLLKQGLESSIDSTHIAPDSKMPESGKICIKSFDKTRSLVIFEGFENKDLASTLTNATLYATLGESKAMCKLKKDEFLWQELIGAKILDKHKDSTECLELGHITDIERISGIDYLVIKTSKELITSGLPKQFLIPNIKRYVLDLSIECVYTQDALGILEQS